MTRLSGLLIGALVVSAASQVLAVEITPERRAALHRCNTEAVNKYGVDGQGAYGRERTEWYKSCMTDAGQIP